MLPYPDSSSESISIPSGVEVSAFAISPLLSKLSCLTALAAALWSSADEQYAI